VTKKGGLGKCHGMYPEGKIQLVFFCIPELAAEEGNRTKGKRRESISFRNEQPKKKVKPNQRQKGGWSVLNKKEAKKKKLRKIRGGECVTVRPRISRHKRKGARKGGVSSPGGRKSMERRLAPKNWERADT